MEEKGEVEEVFGTLGKEESVSHKTSKTSLREQLEADIQDTQTESNYSYTASDLLNKVFIQKTEISINKYSELPLLIM